MVRRMEERLDLRAIAVVWIDGETDPVTLS